MRAEIARALSKKSHTSEMKIREYLRMIKEASGHGRFSIHIPDGRFLMSIKEPLIELGYKVRLLSEGDPEAGRKWANPTGEISWDG